MLKCQRDSYLQEYTTKLVECVEDDFLITVAPGTQKKIKAVALVLEDTILFPEGGGQPCDHGILSFECEGKEFSLVVNQVVRREGRDYHLVEKLDCALTDLRAGTIVHQKLQWDRRKDHMLQHSGQHLLSAVLENTFSFITTSWCLGPECSYIELERESLDKHTIKMVETNANSAIRDQVPVEVEVYSQDDPELKKAKTRGLPEGLTGAVRVIHIKGIDRNMCCGTHVNNLKQLEVIKIIKTEKKVSKKKKTCLLYFLVGEQRVFQKFDEMQQREDLISSALNKKPQEHVELILKMKDTLKVAVKKIQSLQEEIVMAHITAFKSENPNPDFFSLHRPDGDLDLLNFAARQFKDMDIITLFLTVGEKEGHVLLLGEKTLLATVGPMICEIMEGKGKATGKRFQAKVEKMATRSQIEHVLRTTFVAVDQVLRNQFGDYKTSLLEGKSNKGD